jgi:CheY-like chemotaxis protein
MDVIETAFGRGITDVSDVSPRGKAIHPNLMEKRPSILLVDDVEDDLLLMSHAFRAVDFNASLQIVHSGDEAIAYLKGEGAFANREAFPLPTVTLLDLSMPGRNGFEVLAWVRAHPVLKRLAIVILTASARPEDVERAFDLGANSYLVKPSSMPKLIGMICFLRDWLDYNRFPSIHLS